MKTIRTIIATLSAVLLTFALVAWFSVRRNAAFIQRTIYQGFDQTFVVALVMGCAFLLIAIILTVAIVSTDEEEDEEDEESAWPKQRPRAQSAAEKRPAAAKGEQPYRRVSRNTAMAQAKTVRGADEGGFARPKAKAEGKPAPKKRTRAAERPDEIAFRRDEAPVKKEKKTLKPAAIPAAEEETEAILPPTEEIPAPKVIETPEPEETAEAPKTAPEEAPKTAQEEAAEALKMAREETAEAVREEPAEVPQEETPEGAAEPEPAEADEPEDEPAEASAAPAEAPAPEPRKEEGTVRCIFCGDVMSRDSLVCPHCGKKR